MNARCLNAPLGRYDLNVAANQNAPALASIGVFDAAGVLQNLVGTSTVGSGFDVPTTVPVTGSPTITAGETWHFQLWHRDFVGGQSSSNTTGGVAVSFQ